MAVWFQRMEYLPGVSLHLVYAAFDAMCTFLGTTEQSADIPSPNCTFEVKGPMHWLELEECQDIQERFSGS